MIEDAIELVGLRPFRRELGQIGAQATLRSLDVDSDLRWSYQSERVVRNLTAIGQTLLQQSGDSGALSEEGKSAAVFVAQGWHQLARLTRQSRRTPTLLNSALFYELGGYQANAASLAKLAADRSQWSSDPTFEGLLSAFIQRLFMRLAQLPESVGQPPVPEEIPTDNDLTRRAAQAVAARGMSEAAKFFLSGDDTLLKKGRLDLKLARAGFREAGDIVGYNSVVALLHVLPLMIERSTWRRISEANDSLRWQRYIRVLARGLGTDLFDSRSISELWPSQMAALSSGLLDSSHSFAVRMPTSAGKTRIAELAIVNTLVTQPASKCVYIAPYRALAAEIEDSFANLFLDLGYGATAVVGGYDQDEMGNEILNSDDVLIVTPEKLDLLFRLRSDVLDKVAMIVVDEGHIVSDKERGPKFELLVSRLRRRNPTARFLMMSAVVPNETLNEFAAWLGGTSGETVSTDWRPSLLRHGVLEWDGRRGTLRFGEADVVDGGLEFIPNLVRQRIFRHVWPRTARVRRPKFPRSDNRGDVAAETAYRFAPLGPVLIFSMQTNWAQSIAASLLRRVELADLVEEHVPATFSLRRTGRSIVVASEWLGEDHQVTKLLQRGIGFHHGRLPTAVRESIEEDFRSGRLSVVVATNTLAQGVNLPVQTVIIHSCRSRNADGSFRVLSARDYWNIAGRAGRAGMETEGTVIHLALNPRDIDDFQRYADRRTSVERVESALFSMLRDLIESRISSADAAAQLDADLLALLVEEEEAGIQVENLAATLSSSLFQLQATDARLDASPIIRVMSDTARRISRRIPSVETRRLYASTGLSSQSCRAISKHVAANVVVTSRMLAHAGLSEREDLLDLLLEAMSEIREMEPRAALPIDTRALLTGWCNAELVRDLAQQFGADPQAITEFIEDAFSYRLPWGVTGYLRIASVELSTPVRSSLAANIAGMVKFGVPSPEAVWALSAGVASRSAALVVADAYMRQGGERDAGQFRRWLGRLAPDSLAERLSLTGSELEATARAVLRSQPNEYLRRLDQGNDLLPLTSECHVLRFALASGLAYEATQGTHLTIQRDHDSRLNRNAVLLSLGGQPFAYLAADAARALAPELDAGLQVEATIVRAPLYDDTNANPLVELFRVAR